MPSNEYQRAIDTLRDREVYPSFDQMRHLVAAAKPRRRQMAVGVAFFLAGVAMTAAVFSVIGADHNNSRNIVAQNAVLSQRSSVTATVSTNTKTAGQLSILELEHQRSSKPIGISINNEHDDLATTVLQKNEQQADVSRG